MKNLAVLCVVELKDTQRGFTAMGGGGQIPIEIHKAVLVTSVLTTVRQPCVLCAVHHNSFHIYIQCVTILSLQQSHDINLFGPDTVSLTFNNSIWEMSQHEYQVCNEIYNGSA